jgi:hypothetical protein
MASGSQESESKRMLSSSVRTLLRDRQYPSGIGAKRNVPTTSGTQVIPKPKFIMTPDCLPATTLLWNRKGVPGPRSQLRARPLSSGSLVRTECAMIWAILNAHVTIAS